MRPSRADARRRHSLWNAERELRRRSRSSMSIAASAYEDIFQSHRRFVWGLCYRMTGSAADADDLLQETFLIAIRNPPGRTDQPWRPWLVRVAMNLSRDLLRRRKRRHYVGQWLPAPIETEDDAAVASFEPVD